MAITAFPNGVSSFGVPVLGGGPIFTTGSIFFVDSTTGSNANSGADPDHAFSTIDYAVGRCTANKGDYIIVMPGHTETVIAAAGLDLDVAGITIVGIGSGSNRPTINLTTATTADIDVDAANITLVNLLITGGIDALAAVIDVNAADFTMIDCETRDVTGQMTLALVADANADRMKLVRHVHRGTATAGTTSVVQLIGCDDVEIVSPKYYTDSSAALIDVATTAAVRLRVYGTANEPAYLWQENANDLCIKDTITASTGQIGPNVFMVLNDDAANITEAITGATFHVFDHGVHVVNAVNEKSIAINWTASTDA